MTVRKEELREYLCAAGCDEPLIEQLLCCWQEGDQHKAQQLLSGHRRRLLEEIHIGQRRVDCLDYLVYCMKNGR